MPNYGSLVLCPYYQYETDNAIVCECPIELGMDIKTSVKFSCKQDKRDYQGVYCETYECEYCPYYRMIDKKYKEE